MIGQFVQRRALRRPTFCDNCERQLGKIALAATDLRLFARCQHHIDFGIMLLTQQCERQGGDNQGFSDIMRQVQFIQENSSRFQTIQQLSITSPELLTRQLMTQVFQIPCQNASSAIVLLHIMRSAVGKRVNAF